ncbi:VOC family protein [Paroceanicella profunda]|uniref:VOC family protein n=1 Tax=Paroceanicella profunda TaxID=2579971 RepID=A0A5B8FHA3_9RHOB|nr:VOC family protein [Paroceanicella profunda]QDL91947.1 VOC family protein [Paroceanicella profunda]
MARLRHIAIMVRDLEAATKFYKDVFEFEDAGSETIGAGTANYLTDGVINLALLHFTDKTPEEMDKLAGLNHFGIQVDDVAKYEDRVNAAGGCFFFELAGSKQGNSERKYKDPEGVVFDISKHGWVGTDGRLKTEAAE